MKTKFTNDWLQSRVGLAFLTSPPHSDQPWGPSSILSNRYWDLSMRTSGQHEADHLPPSSGEVKNAWRFTSMSTIHFHEVLLKAREDFIFTLQNN